MTRHWWVLFRQSPLFRLLLNHPSLKPVCTIPHPHSIPSISTGQREPPEGAELSDSLSSAPQPPKPKSSDGDLKSVKIQMETLCSFAHSGCYHKSVAVMHFVSINTFLLVAPQRKIACHGEEIVVKAVFLPRGWRLAAILLRACFISKG